MINRPTLVRSARNAALVAAIVTMGIILSAVLRGAGRRPSPQNQHFWIVAAGGSALMFAGVFSIFFVWNLISSVRQQPVDEILEQGTPESELLRTPLYGFVAMEFYRLILNRTFVVFVASDGLYGWKATGIVTNANRKYYEPLQEMLADSEFRRDLPAIRKLAHLAGGFFHPASEVASVTSDDRRQWGMGGIPHAGHLHVRLASGTSRKLILLGEVNPDEVRDRIIASLGAGITSMV